MKRVAILVSLVLSACGENPIPAGYRELIGECIDRTQNGAYCIAYYQCAAEKGPASEYPAEGYIDCGKAALAAAGVK